jgi:Uma2 family endonuclease
MTTSTAPLISPADLDAEEYLPESDGKPMAETDVHRKLMIGLLHALTERYREQPQVYVSGNIFIYYRDEAGVRQSVSPDIFVAFGVAKKDRRIYKLEDEGKGPEVVIELTSTSTKVEDLVTKHYIYANMGVREYFLFDPYSETIRPALRGFRFAGGEYVPIAGASLHSEVLGLELQVEQGQLRLYDPKTGERLRTPEEAEAHLRASETKAAQEVKARQEAEAKAALELKARQEAEAKALQESTARQALEAETARLREELERLRGKKI